MFWGSSTADRRGQGSQCFPCDSPTSWHVHPVPPVSEEREEGGGGGGGGGQLKSNRSYIYDVKAYSPVTV